MNVNQVILVGRIASAPEYTDGNDKRIKFRIAVQRSYRSRKTNEFEADFFNVTQFGTIAETHAKWLRKGKEVGVVGSLNSSESDDNEGNRRFFVGVLADHISYGRDSEKNQTEQNNTPTTTSNSVSPTDIVKLTKGFARLGLKGQDLIDAVASARSDSSTTTPNTNSDPKRTTVTLTDNPQYENRQMAAVTAQSQTVAAEDTPFD